MTGETFASEFLLFSLGAMAIVVFWQLYRTRNGMLRKIMMAYFATEAFMYFTFAIYWWLKMKGRVHFPIVYMLPAWLLPKVIIKAIFLDWIRKHRSLH